MKKKPEITRDCVVPMLETKFIKVADLQYAPGRHYYDATRHALNDLTATKTAEEFHNMLPDAVSCFLILKTPDAEPRLLMHYEFRYPTGQFLLGPAAGLIDPQDREKADPILSAARREIYEETGLRLRPEDRLYVVDPVVFSSPGMTDESNALVCAVADLPDLHCLNQDHGEETECFDGFCLLTREKARKLLKTGKDERGAWYSLYTWAAMMYFLSDLWQET